MTKPPTCPVYAALADQFREEAQCGQLAADIQQLFTTIVGRRFSPTPVPKFSPRPFMAQAFRSLYRRLGLLNRFARLERFGHGPVTLSSFYARGGRQAARITPFIDGQPRALEYGGGIGRLGKHLAPHTSRLVSCDIQPLTVKYGPALCPQVEFVLLDELDDSPVFDFAYSIAVFFHLDDAAQRAALEYVHRRLRPGGRFLVDLKLGPADIPMTAASGWVRTTPEKRFLALCQEYFEIQEVELFNRAFLCTKSVGHG